MHATWHAKWHGVDIVVVVLVMQLAVPVTASDDDLRHVAAFRSRARLPVSYLPQHFSYLCLSVVDALIKI